MRKTVQGLQIDTDKLIFVTEKNGVQIYRTSKFYYLAKFIDKFTLLKGEKLKKISKEFGFKIERYQKSTNYIHGCLNDLEYEKFKRYKKKYSLSANNTIKKIINDL